MTQGYDNSRLFTGLTALVAASLPFGFRFPSYAIILLFAGWIFAGGFRYLVASVRKTPVSFLLAAWFLFCLISLLWSENMNEGFRQLETRLPLLILPVLLVSGMHFLQERKHIVLFAFIISTLASCLFCLGHGVYNYYHEITLVNSGQLHDTYINTNYFFASLLSWFLHPSYLAMYLCFCMAILLWLFHTGKFRLSVWLLIILLCFITVFIFLLTSKMGILTGSLIWVGYILYWIRRSGKYLLAGSVAVVLCLLVFFVARKSEMVSSRFTYLYEAMFAKKINPASRESNEVRVLIWGAATHLIGENLFTGVGTGDCNKVLRAEYLQRGMTGAYEEELNTHNQFLQTALETGIPGFLMLLCALILPAIQGLRNRRFLPFFLTAILILNFLVESMLQTQAGTLFTGFFVAFLSSSE